MATKAEENEFHKKLDDLVHDTFGHSSDEKKKMKEDMENITDPLEDIFINYAGKTIEMDFTDMNSDWANLLKDLGEVLSDEELEQAMERGDLESYFDDYNITLIEPISDPEIDIDVVKRGSAKIDIDRMRKIAGLPALDDPASLNEEDKDTIELTQKQMDDLHNGKTIKLPNGSTLTFVGKKNEEVEEGEEEIGEILSQDYMLTFNDEDIRDQAIMYYSNPENIPQEVQKYTKGNLQMEPEDAVSIVFPTQNNMKSCGLDERKLNGIVEIMHRAINRKYPNSRTVKMETDG